MNPVREAAEAIDQAEKRHPGLKMRMDVSHKYVHITADLGEQQVSRSVSWDEIELAHINVLSANVALAVNAITGKAF